ncbi:MAG: hypothetical protein N3A54_02555 [Patescibacteria group bacterium]|nr:hypothetical protein [Patescibacteria group bacterium]
MAFVESSYENIVGTHGEIGMMQVIPKDGHIQEIYCNILNIRVCNVTAKELNEILKKNTKLAFRVGVEEYLYWKEQYRNKYKKMYWEKYPKWLLVDKDELFIKNHKKKWETIKKILGDFVFIAHYNWGGRFLFSDSAWAYLFKVSNVFLEFNNYFVDGEKE